MNRQSSTCPQCRGFTVILTFRGQSLGPCEMCKGTGRIPEHVKKWAPYGERLKAERIARRLTLRKAAAQLGVDPSNLSKMERGIIAPQPLWESP